METMTREECARRVAENLGIEDSLDPNATLDFIQGDLACIKGEACDPDASLEFRRGFAHRYELEAIADHNTSDKFYDYMMAVKTISADEKLELLRDLRKTTLNNFSEDAA